MLRRRVSNSPTSTHTNTDSDGDRSELSSSDSSCSPSACLLVCLSACLTVCLHFDLAPVGYGLTDSRATLVDCWSACDSCVGCVVCGGKVCDSIPWARDRRALAATRNSFVFNSNPLFVSVRASVRPKKSVTGSASGTETRKFFH